MEEGKVYIYGGTGHGKSPAAIGCGLIAAAKGAQVVIIQFLKGKGLTENDYQRRLEPEIKLFRFEKSDEDFVTLPKEKQEEEARNIRNGLNYAKKVLNTGECDMLILDEVLGLIDNKIITVEDLKNVLESRDGETDIIMTGISWIRMYAPWQTMFPRYAQSSDGSAAAICLCGRPRCRDACVITRKRRQRGWIKK